MASFGKGISINAQKLGMYPHGRSIGRDTPCPEP